MLPLSLTIEGLYSYQKRQHIDFQNLTEAGLFGVFGSVGSGKSSILEAITFALYGETERLNARDGRAYNMMNLKSKHSFIEFEFLNFEDKLYKIIREFKRNSKRFDDVKASHYVYYEKVEGQYIPLENPNPEKIVGLNYHNFKRTIIIPQGQFKEFIELGAKDRTNMMKEIFGLHRFDLAEKTKKIADQNALEVSHLEGQMIGFDAINAEEIELLKTDFELKKNKKEQTQNILNATQEKVAKIESIKNLTDLLNQKKNELLKKEQEKKDFRILEEKSKAYEIAQLHFSSIIQNLDRLKNEEVNNADGLKNEMKTLSDNQKLLAENDTLLEKIKVKYLNLNDSKKVEKELDDYILIKKQTVAIAELDTRLNSGNQKIKEKKEALESIHINIQSVENEVEEVQKNKMNTADITAISNWYQHLEHLQKNHDNHCEKIVSNNTAITTIKEYLSKYELEIDQIENHFNNQIDELETEISGIQTKIQELKIQEKWSEHAENLKDGVPCPLCGATEHPTIMTIKTAKKILPQLANEEKKVQNKVKDLREAKLEAAKKIDQIKFYVNENEKEKQNLEGINREIQAHNTLFIWENYNANDKTLFEAAKEKAIQTDKLITEKNNTAKSLKSDYQKQVAELEKFQATFEKINKEKNIKIGEINTLQNNLTELNITEFQDKNTQELEQIKENLSKENLEIEENHHEYTNQKVKLEQAIAVSEALLITFKEKEKKIKDEKKALQSTLDKNLIKFTLGSVEYITEILKEKRDLEEDKKSIQKFHLDYKTLQNSIQETTKSLNNQSYTEEELTENKKELENLQSELKIIEEATILAQSKLKETTEKFEQKKSLLTTLKTVKNKAENLKKLTQLFKGGGFVEYISSIQLRQLCDIANLRFHRMTKNQLSLCLNDTYDFEVIDYLNEGKTRSVKTLSGGQAFQVALSLALALSESVHYQSKTQKKFFFIDEGFGTQDSESVEMVFDTLMNLQKENKIVGIISHVEQLKEKIPRSLQITKNEETGSTISLN